jgi:ankyrin repeat protein
MNIVQTVDDGGWTPLLSASSAGNEEVVCQLLKASADANYVEENVIPPSASNNFPFSSSHDPEMCFCEIIAVFVKFQLLDVGRAGYQHSMLLAARAMLKWHQRSSGLARRWKSRIGESPSSISPSPQ